MSLTFISSGRDTNDITADLPGRPDSVAKAGIQGQREGDPHIPHQNQEEEGAPRWFLGLSATSSAEGGTKPHGSTIQRLLRSFL